MAVLVAPTSMYRFMTADSFFHLLINSAPKCLLSTYSLLPLLKWNCLHCIFSYKSTRQQIWFVRMTEAFRIWLAGAIGSMWWKTQWDFSSCSSSLLFFFPSRESMKCIWYILKQKLLIIITWYHVIMEIICGHFKLVQGQMHFHLLWNVELLFHILNH